MAEQQREASAADDGDPRRTPPAALRRVMAGISAAERVVGAVTLLVLLLLVLLQTGMRFLPVGGWVWTGELARFCLVWMTFALSGYLMGRDDHITLEVVDFVASGRPLWFIRAFANVVVALICLGFTIESAAMVSDDGGQVSPAMGLPLALVYVIPLAGFVLTGLRAALAVVWRSPVAHPVGTSDDEARASGGASAVAPGGSAS